MSGKNEDLYVLIIIAIVLGAFFALLNVAPYIGATLIFVLAAIWIIVMIVLLGLYGGGFGGDSGVD
jgi:hypothetical protein